MCGTENMIAAGFECCHPAESNATNQLDLQALKRIATELLDGQVKEEGTVNLAHPAKWSPAARSFLAATTSATSAKELLEVRRLSMDFDSG